MRTVFIHPQALCDSDNIGSGSRVAAFAHILEGAEIGESTSIASHTLIESDVKIGDRVTVGSGVQLWNGARIQDDVFIGPNVTFTNMSLPTAQPGQRPPMPVIVEASASIGANATILPGLTIGRNAMIGAGAVVTRSVPPNAIVVGNPARIAGYVDAERPTPSSGQDTTSGAHTRDSTVSGVTTIHAPLVRDIRGSLIAREFGDSIPFVPRRSFIVIDVPSAEIRGEHAHRECHQFITCVQGAVSLVAENGISREEFRLDRPTVGIHVPPMIWCSQFGHSSDAILLVYASHHYDPGDYIRDYQQFLQAVHYQSSTSP